jgi:hypothetical protein
MRSKKSQIEEIIRLILEFLKTTPDGASRSEIQDHLHNNIKPRTLQRYLEKLKQSGGIHQTGAIKATRYYAVQKKDTRRVAEISGRARIIAPVELSDESEKILRIISEPIEKRIPVPYHYEFLENYTPNQTSYLTGSEKQLLLKTGGTGLPNAPAGTYAKQILKRLLVDLSWNSSRLEGNTYSLLDTEQLINAGHSALDKTSSETQMILNHKEAIEFIVSTDGYIGFNRYTICNIHALLSNNLLPDPAAPGRLRRFGVGISRSVYTPLEIPQQIELIFDQILEKANKIGDPFEQAFFAMVHLPYLQPFEDVNKRVSRLAANIPLNRHNLVPLSFTDVPEDLYISGLLAVYELNRIELLKDVFLWAYQRSAARYGALRQSLGEPDEFRMKYRREIKDLISYIVSSSLNRDEARHEIWRLAEGLPENDQGRFVEYVETELLSLHQGNFARYSIRPAEFENWKVYWASVEEKANARDESE